MTFVLHREHVYLPIQPGMGIALLWNVWTLLRGLLFMPSYRGGSLQSSHYLPGGSDTDSTAGSDGNRGQVSRLQVHIHLTVRELNRGEESFNINLNTSLAHVS
jgi:hypothetical protein